MRDLRAEMDDPESDVGRVLGEAEARSATKDRSGQGAHVVFSKMPLVMMRRTDRPRLVVWTVCPETRGSHLRQEFGWAW